MKSNDHKPGKDEHPAATKGGEGREGSVDFLLKKTPTNEAAKDVRGPEEGSSQLEPLQLMSVSSALRYRSEDPQDGLLVFRLKQGLIILAAAIFILGLPWFILRKDPVANLSVQHAIIHFQKISSRLGMGGYSQNLSEAMVRQLRISNKTASESIAKKTPGALDCSSVVEENLNLKLRSSLDNNGRYLLLSCLLFQDSPQAVLQVIKANYGDPKRFQANLDSWLLLPEQLAVIEAQRRTQILTWKPQQNYSDCRRWMIKSECLLRFVDQARQPLRVKLDDGYAILKKSINKMNPVLQVWLGLAAGTNATKNAEYAKADKILSEAARHFQTIYDPFLQREIFRSRLFNAARSQNVESFSAIWNQRPIKLIESDQQAFLDIQLYRTMVLNPEKTASALEDFFSQPESVQRFRYDPSFVRTASELSIRNKQSFAGLQYLDRLIAQQSPGKSIDGEWLPILRARLLLANSRFEEMLKELQPIEKSAIRSQEFFHLKGTALILSSENKRFKLLAAVEFQKAVNIQPNAVHFTALIMAFIEANDLKRAEEVWKFWKRIKIKSGDEPWQALMEGLLRYRRGDRGAAKRIWAEIGLRNPEFELITRIARNLEEDSNYLEIQLVRRLALMFPIDGPFGPLVSFW